MNAQTLPPGKSLQQQCLLYMRSFGFGQFAAGAGRVRVRERAWKRARVCLWLERQKAKGDCLDSAKMQLRIQSLVRLLPLGLLAFTSTYIRVHTNALLSARRSQINICLYLCLFVWLCHETTPLIACSCIVDSL